MKRIVLWFMLSGMLFATTGSAQVYEFRKPNVPVNDDSLGRHHHFNVSEGQHSVSARGDTFYAVWSDYRQSGYPYNPDIYFARSTDSGMTFLPNIRVNDDVDTASQNYPSLCLDSGGVIHVAWMDSRLGEWGIYYSRSLDGGRTFLPNQILSDSVSYFPTIASNGNGIVCVAWFGNADQKIWIVRSGDNGQTFSRKSLVNDSLAYDNDNVSLALDSAGRAYVAWHRYEFPYSHIYLSRSTDSGDSLFYPSVRVSGTVIRVWSAEDPSVTLNKQGKIYVALLDKRNTAQALHVYVAQSIDGGVSFLRNVDVSDNYGNSGQRWPSITCDDSGNVYVAWTDYRNGYRCIYFARSTDPADTAFSPNILVNDTAGLSGTDRYGASLAINERSEAFVTWSDNRVSGSIYLYDIFSSVGIRKSNGIEEISKMVPNVVGSIHCNPSPFTSFASVPGHEKESFALYDVSGRKVGVFKGDRVGWGVSPGVYFLRAEKGDRRPVRIVKLR